MGNEKLKFHIMKRLNVDKIRGGGGQVKLYPYEKGGGRRKSFSHAEEGAQHV